MNNDIFSLIFNNLYRHYTFLSRIDTDNGALRENSVFVCEESGLIAVVLATCESISELPTLLLHAVNNMPQDYKVTKTNIASVIGNLGVVKKEQFFIHISPVENDEDVAFVSLVIIKDEKGYTAVKFSGPIAELDVLRDIFQTTHDNYISREKEELKEDPDPSEDEEDFEEEASPLNDIYLPENDTYLSDKNTPEKEFDELTKVKGFELLKNACEGCDKPNLLIRNQPYGNNFTMFVSGHQYFTFTLTADANSIETLPCLIVTYQDDKKKNPVKECLVIQNIKELANHLIMDLVNLENNAVYTVECFNNNKLDYYSSVTEIKEDILQVAGTPLGFCIIDTNRLQLPSLSESLVIDLILTEAMDAILLLPSEIFNDLWTKRDLHSFNLHEAGRMVSYGYAVKEWRQESPVAQRMLKVVTDAGAVYEVYEANQASYNILHLKSVTSNYAIHVYTCNVCSFSLKPEGVNSTKDLASMIRRIYDLVPTVNVQSYVDTINDALIKLPSSDLEKPSLIPYYQTTDGCVFYNKAVEDAVLVIGTFPIDEYEEIDKQLFQDHSGNVKHYLKTLMNDSVTSGHLEFMKIKFNESVSYSLLACYSGGYVTFMVIVQKD